ncbi:MAG: hypothetical protein HY544_05805 [Candidatus Diapherotrites archaeon]|uniref:Uncharacterized protein n=1 Tax=Candidatus Iainarchaeum sp. TaxID=3101447 RepID=A0A8T3YLR4_9ARCH|nr:hypothetical protein [Candidatus Diapherotrites archaeon]
MNGFLNAGVSPLKYGFLRIPEYQALSIFLVPSVLLPFIIHSAQFPNQLVVGTLVNALLACSALFLTLRSSLPIILLPSLAALASGIVFGGFTAFLAYLVPFIWLGNAAYVYALKTLKVAMGVNYFISIAAASFLKALAIGAPSFALISFGLLPAAFLVPMNLVQFATAFMGGSLAAITRPAWE